MGHKNQVRAVHLSTSKELSEERESSCLFFTPLKRGSEGAGFQKNKHLVLKFFSLGVCTLV